MTISPNPSPSLSFLLGPGVDPEGKCLSEPTRLTVGDLSMNLLTREVTRGSRKIELQPIEFSLLEYLMRKRRTGRLKNHDHGACVALQF